MSEPTPRSREVFFDVFEPLPRQGPGNRACAERALALCTGLPPSPRILDLGCGAGGQALHLAELTSGTIVALDSHAASIDRLRATVAERGLGHRVEAVVGDMAKPDLPAESFDLVWSEGALYNIGIQRALGVCRGLLRRNGCLAFTDAVWRMEDPPPPVAAMFEDYAAMGRAEDVLEMIHRSGLSPVGHFTLPDEAWWEDFYTPMERRIEALRRQYGDDAPAQAALDEIAQEPEMHRQHAAYYAYEFFVARRED